MIAAVLLAPDIAPLQAVRLAALDVYQQLSPRVPRSSPVVIVAIDDPSLARYGQWPWPRTLLARLLRAIADGGAAAVGIDIIMAEADRLSPERLPALVEGLEPDIVRRLATRPSNDARLGEVIARLPVVLGVAGIDKDEAPAPGRRRTAFRIFGEDPLRFARHFGGVLRSVPEVDGAAAGHGLINPDAYARVVRRLPLVAAVGSDLMPSFGLEMLRVAARQSVVSVRTGPRGIESVGVGDLVVPTEPDGAVWVHYGPSDPLRFVSAADVLEGRRQAQRFGQRLVLVGVTAIGLGDHHPTPVAARMAGVEIHAQLLENIYDGEHLTRPRWTRWAEAAALGAGGLVIIAASVALPVTGAVLGAVAMVAATVGVGWLAYLRQGVLLDVVLPAWGLGLVFAVALAAGLAETRSQRRALERQLQAEREAAARVAGELAAARRIQMGILPSETVLAADQRLSVWGFLEPARAVGGDLYDFFPVDRDRVVFLVGDVSGKGVPGSLFMAVSKALCKSSVLRLRGDVAAAMREANAEISRDNPEALFVTAWAGVLDVHTGALRYSSAGHEPALVLGAGAPKRLGLDTGPPLCVLDDFPYEVKTASLRPGETVCLITDGVTEAMNGAGELYGRQRLEAVVAGLGPAPDAVAIGEAIRRDVARFAAGTEPSDDVTILVVKWHGPGSGAAAD